MRIHKEVNLTQGTDSWVRWRRSGLGGSDAAVVMGVSPYRSPYQLWEEKLGLGQQQETNASMRRGTELEPMIRGMTEDILGFKLMNKTIMHDRLSYMFASLDGISEDGETVVEIKTANKELHAMAKSGVVPEIYQPQLWHQMEVCGVDQVQYVSYAFLNGKDDIVIVPFHRNNREVMRLLDEERAFWDCVQNFEAPPLSDLDYIKIEDPEWFEKGKRCKEIAKLIRDLELEAEELKDSMIQMAGNRNAVGHGMRLTKVVRKGNVDVKAIAEAYQLDLEKYRKGSITSWRLS